jgi:hypothetical protein
MVEIRIADDVKSPYCERSAEIVRVHASWEHSLEDLVNLLGELLSTLEIEYLENIWSNDLADRIFQRLDDGSFVIRLK